MAKSKGTRIIEKAVGKFKGIINELDEGIRINDSSIENGAKAIEAIQADINLINESSVEAKRFKEGLQGVLGISKDIE